MGLSIILAFVLACLAGVYSDATDGSYEITLKTGNEYWAGTSAQIYIKLYGENKTSDKIVLQTKPDQIVRDSEEKFSINAGKNLGAVRKIEVGHDNTGKSAGWYLQQVTVLSGQSNKVYYFYINKWISDDSGYTTTIIAQITSADRENCGVAPTSRVIHGQTAKANAWPWMVRLVTTELFEKNFIECGGTLIHPQYVLTAAHCLEYYKKAKNYRLTLGEHDHSKDEGTEQFVDVDELIKHPKYNPSFFDHDIALLKLEQPAKINKFVKLACLPATNDYAEQGSKCIGTGWGQFTDVLPVRSATLNQVTLFVTNQTECDNVYKQTITKSMLCAGGGGLCHGDDGGPLFCKNDKNRYDVHGVSNFYVPSTFGGCNSKKPTGFSRVTSHIGWIESVIGTTVKYV